MLKSNKANIFHISHFSSHISAFTLIELLIVVSILGVLGAFVLNTFPSAQGRARDSQRQSDIKQYQTALETYANRSSGLYPVQTSGNAPSNAVCTSLGLTNCIVDPTNGNDTCGSGSGTCNYIYRYITNAGGTQYALWARLRRPATPSNLFFITCSNGRSGTSTTAPSLVAGNVVCPL